MLPAIVAVVVSLGPPSFALPFDADAHVLGAEAHLTGSASDGGLALDYQGTGGHQRGALASSCIPDKDSRCDLEVDCAPGTTDCWATYEPRPPWPCRKMPDGSIYCDPEGNGSEPDPGDGGTAPPAPPSPPDPDPPQPPVREAREAREAARQAWRDARDWIFG